MAAAPAALAAAGDPEAPEHGAAALIACGTGGNPHRLTGPGPGKALEPVAPDPGARGEIGEIAISTAGGALAHQGSHLLLGDALDVAEAEADSGLARARLDRALDLARIHVDSQHFDPPALRLMRQ